MTSQLLVGWIPGLGNMVNAGTALTLTEALGWKLAEEFDRRAIRRSGKGRRRRDRNYRRLTGQGPDTDGRADG